MKKLGASVAVVVVMGGVLAIFLISGDSDEPELTARDRAEAREIVSNSAELERILGDRGYAVKAIGIRDPEVVKRAPELLERLTIVQVIVDPPRMVRAQWPYIGELHPCRRYWVPLTVRDLREVYAYVDLSQSLVAAIVPSESSGLRDWAVLLGPPALARRCDVAIAVG